MEEVSFGINLVRIELVGGIVEKRSAEKTRDSAFRCQNIPVRQVGAQDKSNRERGLALLGGLSLSRRTS